MPHIIFGENTKNVSWSNVLQIEFQDGKMLENPCDSIKVTYSTPVTLLLTDILFSVFFAEILSMVLSVKIIFKGLY